jgi:hypothetical protein
MASNNDNVDLSTPQLRREAARRIITVWRAVGDGNNDELLARYIANTMSNINSNHELSVRAA